MSLNNLKFVGEVNLSPVKGIFDFMIKRKLRCRIEKIAKEYKSDVAVIHTLYDIF